MSQRTFFIHPFGNILFEAIRGCTGEFYQRPSQRVASEGFETIYQQSHAHKEHADATKEFENQSCHAFLRNLSPAASFAQNRAIVTAKCHLLRISSLARFTVMSPKPFSNSLDCPCLSCGHFRND